MKQTLRLVLPVLITFFPHHDGKKGVMSISDIVEKDCSRIFRVWRNGLFQDLPCVGGLDALLGWRTIAMRLEGRAGFK